MSLVHNVFFILNDDSTTAQDQLVAACHKYLKNHPGIISFTAGKRTSDLCRPVNDQEFHVGLHIVFDTREAHDVYQTAPDHLQFIEENKATWKSVRVCDTDA